MHVGSGFIWGIPGQLNVDDHLVGLRIRQISQVENKVGLVDPRLY
jgi:hypothetical protein